jgi:hypothetical protein
LAFTRASLTEFHRGFISLQHIFCDDLSRSHCLRQVVMHISALHRRPFIVF